MIISASRRTDIPAFFSEWFINRIREQYCCTVNPFNRNQVSRISLSPKDVDLIVFWTKNANPMLKYIDELTERNYKYFFQYTINGYSKYLEPYTPDLNSNIETFINLSEKIGSNRMIWRYDPIVFSNLTDFDYHYKNFVTLVDKLKGKTERVVISIVDDYRGSRSRLSELQKLGFKLYDNYDENNEFKALIRAMSTYANNNQLDIFSCAELIDMTEQGIYPGKCIDNSYIKKVFNIDVAKAKDKGQRSKCGCVESKDIGIYDTCMHRCRYCYANRSDSIVKSNIKDHNINSPSLIGWYEKRESNNKDRNGEQLSILNYLP
jgi:hypothetical protein